MTKLEFKTTINAPREKIWNILWDNDLYQEWTAVFSEGSRAVTDWKEGSKVHFVNAEGEGMLSLIERKKDPEYMSFRHIGMVNKGVEDTESELVKQWAGGHENYTLTQQGNQTELLVDIDVTEDHKEYFQNTWPKAMDKIKELAEKN